MTTKMWLATGVFRDILFLLT